jgi:hypothetical protein
MPYTISKIIHIEVGGCGNGFGRGIADMIHGSFSTSQPLRSNTSRYTAITDLPAMTTYGVKQIFVAASLTKNAARFAIFAAQPWVIAGNLRNTTANRVRKNYEYEYYA